jgi:arsenical pump membrane protein
MDPAAAIAAATLVLVVLLAVVRPRIGLTFSPGIAAVLGVVVLLAARILAPADLVQSMAVQWRPLVTLTCIMVMTGVVQEVGAFERLTAWIERRARTRPATSTFTLVFALAVITPALLNSDAAILILTPLVVSLVRRLYAGRAIAVAFAFAIFLEPGVAPFIVSNPMNMIVAEFAGLRFNSYAAVMLPISLASALVTYTVLRIAFRRALREAVPGPAGPPTTIHRHPAERAAVGLLLAVFFAYPICATLGLEIWYVAVAGAVCSLALGRVYRVAPVQKLASHVSADILLFLWGIFLVVQGLRAVAAVDLLRSIYGAAPDLGTVGVTSALGSALIDNHPMSLLNMLAIDNTHDAKLLLAALVGGDIGPRLLPIGSLAGLLWMDLLRRQGVAVGIRSFVRIGTLALVPTLTVSLALLWLL